MKKINGLLYLTSFLVSFSLMLPAQTIKPVDVEPSVVQIIISTPGPNNQDSPLPIGTGFFAGDGKTIVTAAHVYWDAGRAGNERRKHGIYARKIFAGKTIIFTLTPLTIERLPETPLKVSDPRPSQVTQQRLPWQAAS
jgi:hypothetical protein